MIVRVGYQGGLVPMGYAFVDTPALLVSGNGRVFTAGVVPAVFPGPLLPVVNVRTINEAGVQAMLGIVDRSRLSSDLPDYTGGTNVADAPETVLTINANGNANANGKSYVHSAYALGIDSPESPARQTLQDAITALTDVDKAAGTSNLGTNQPFVATMYRLQARPVGRRLSALSCRRVARRPGVLISAC